MLSAQQCLNHFGDPTANETRHMTVIRNNTGIAAIPKKLYVNKCLAGPLLAALAEIKEQGLADLIHSYDGCFNIRKKRNGTTQSLHSWGLAIDINASTNQMGTKGDMDPRLVAIFKKHGFNWGGDWRIKDCQHFELALLPACISS